MPEEQTLNTIKNVVYKYIDSNSSKTITIEPNEPVIIIINLYKNIIATVE